MVSRRHDRRSRRTDGRRPVPRPRRDRLARAALQPDRDRALSLLAVRTGWWWLLALLALQLALGLTLGRRCCLPCLAYFELIQPRFGEGPLEDSRPPAPRTWSASSCSRPPRSRILAGLDDARDRARAARRRARAARRGHRLLHRLRGLQARLPAHRQAVRLLPAAPGGAGMTWQFSLAGLFVGILVGMTGMGGGSLMTPILILLFGFNAKVAVGTDILHGAVFKSFGAVAPPDARHGARAARLLDARRLGRRSRSSASRSRTRSATTA